MIVIQDKSVDEKISKTDVDLYKSLIYTYAEMAKSITVLENTSKSLDIGELDANSITVSPVSDTQILKVSVQNQDAQLAKDIADTLVEEFTLEISRITNANNVSVVDYARLPKNPIKPNKLMNIVIAGILGEMLVLMIVFLMEYFDNTLKTEKDIEKYLGVSIIGTIPNFSQGSKKSYGKIQNKRKSSVANS
jgi:capsular polysaccharide biosynthesis protein